MDQTDSPDQHRASMLTFTLQQSILGKVALQQQQQRGPPWQQRRHKQAGAELLFPEAKGSERSV